MKKEPRAELLDALSSDSFKSRVRKAQRFENISGGGIIKMIQRLLISPRIYVPYVLFAKLGMSQKYALPTTLFWGRTIRIPLDDYDALILYMYGGLFGIEQKLMKYCIKNLNLDDVFYDIGANRGFYTFLAAELCKEIHTFEPLSRLTEIIKKNVRPEDTIIANPIALSDKNGSIDFYVMESTMINTINESVASHNKNIKITVPTMTIDEYVKTHTKPTFLKIDAEGAEHQIIQGGTQFLTTHSPTIALEVWGNENGGDLSMKAAEKLRSLGYRSYRLGNEGAIEEAQGNLSDEVTKNGGDNFIFKK